MCKQLQIRCAHTKYDVCKTIGSVARDHLCDGRSKTIHKTLYTLSTKRVRFFRVIFESVDDAAVGWVLSSSLGLCVRLPQTKMSNVHLFRVKFLGQVRRACMLSAPSSPAPIHTHTECVSGLIMLQRRNAKGGFGRLFSSTPPHRQRPALWAVWVVLPTVFWVCCIFDTFRNVSECVRLFCCCCVRLTRSEPEDHRK